MKLMEYVKSCEFEWVTEPWPPFLVHDCQPLLIGPSPHVEKLVAHQCRNRQTHMPLPLLGAVHVRTSSLAAAEDVL